MCQGMRVVGKSQKQRPTYCLQSFLSRLPGEGQCVQRRVQGPAWGWMWVDVGRPFMCVWSQVRRAQTVLWPFPLAPIAPRGGDRSRSWCVSSSSLLNGGRERKCMIRVCVCIKTPKCHEAGSGLWGWMDGRAGAKMDGRECSFDKSFGTSSSMKHQQYCLIQLFLLDFRPESRDSALLPTPFLEPLSHLSPRLLEPPLPCSDRRKIPTQIKIWCS